VHQIRFRPGLRPGPRWGSLQRSPRPPSWTKGALLLRGRGGKGRERKGRGRDWRGRGGEGTGGEGEETGGEGEGEGKERREAEEKGPAPLLEIPGSAPEY